MTNPNVGIVAAQNGKEIINGLNLLAIIATHPVYNRIVKTIIIPHISQQTQIPIQKLMQDVHDALNYIDEINKTLSNCDAQGIQFGLAVEKKEIDPHAH